MNEIRIRTVGLHPLTDALQLHALIDALHSYGLDRHVKVEPREGYHELIVPQGLIRPVGYALVAYTFRLILKEILMRLSRRKKNDKGKKGARRFTKNHLKIMTQLLREAEEMINSSRHVKNGDPQAIGKLSELSEVIIKHLEKRHPLLPDVEVLRRKAKSFEEKDTLNALENVLGGELSQVIGKAKRVIPVIPSIGKFYYVDASIGRWDAQEFDPVCGRLIRAGLRLALTYPIRTAEGNYKVGIALVTPSSGTNARDVWYAQASLRTFRHRWIRGRASWGKACTVLMLLDAFRITKVFNENAAGYIVEAILAQTQGTMAWRNPADAVQLKMLYLPGAEDVGYVKYYRGVAVVTESVVPAYPAVKLADALERIGGSVDWLVDELIIKNYMERRGNERVLNYAFVSALVRALTEYDAESLYFALREAAVASGGERVLVSDPYQLERLVAAMEFLGRE